MHHLPIPARVFLGPAVAAILLCGGFATVLRAEPPPLAERFLLGDGIVSGVAALDRHLAAHGDDDEARFGLGVLQFMRAVERLGQSLHHHGGLGGESGVARIFPLLRLPVPANPKPAETSYDDVRGMIKAFIADLAAAERTLAAIRDENVALPLRFGLVRLDLDGDGKAGEAEALWRLHAAFTGQPRPNAASERELERQRAAEALVVRLDRGDAFWLQGYCHLLSAIGEVALAYDMGEHFDVIAPYLFDRPRGQALPAGMFSPEAGRWFSAAQLADLYVFMFKTPWPVIDRERMPAALAHLEEVVRLSRESWQAIEAETDDADEWIPNANQACVIPGVRVSPEMIAGWREFLDQAEAILAGRRLVPHWRLAPGQGINLRRVFLEPRPFDVVGWAQGAAAVPYAEKGECSSSETWRRLQQVFRGNFIGFAIWFN